MVKNIQIQLSPKIAASQELLKDCIAKHLKIIINDIKHIKIIKRSIDARQKKIKVNLILDIYINEKFKDTFKRTIYKNVSKNKKVLIIGAGPSGLFSALKLIEKGLKPVILERGNDISNRKVDLGKLNRNHIVNEDSNYCFGEGGAGTFSDGKLYTRSKKKGDVNNILKIFVEHGASEDIMIDAQPHIGTNKLPNIIKNIRETIIKNGGEIMFNSRVVDIKIKNKSVYGVELKNGNLINSDKIILATGHSARDIFNILHKKNIALEAKKFALGIRIEHSQELINRIQYKSSSRSEFLPPAPYSIAKQIKGRGVYSFCMCPGGVIAPCATSPGEVVTNGWSPSKRHYPTANSGIVVELNIEDFKKYKKFGPLAGLEFQKDIEKNCCIAAGNSQKVPAQRLVDFTNKKFSQNIPKTSYIPGTTSLIISDLLPNIVSTHLIDGLKEIGKNMKGYFTNEAIIHAPESRTSSPIRIPRDKDTLEHPQVKGLYPCGEGAGYAGGIVSAAIDGQKCANKC